MDEIIGIVENKSSLKSYKVNYEQIDLINNDFDYEKIEERVKKGNIKVKIKVGKASAKVLLKVK